MALFGAPLSYEDHAVRACYAALRMQARLAAYSDELQRNCGIPFKSASASTPVSRHPRHRE